MCRTIQTTLSAFQPELSRGVKCFALPELQEYGAGCTETGSGAFVLRRAFKDTPINFDLVPDDWASNKGKWAHKNEAIDACGQTVLRWLKSRAEDEIVVVSHGGFLRRLTDEKCCCGKYHGRAWDNAEFRSYSIAETRSDCPVDGTVNRLALVEETAESRQRRGEMLALLRDSEEERPGERGAKQVNGAESSGRTALKGEQAGMLSYLRSGSRSIGVTISRLDGAVLIYFAAAILVILPLVAGRGEQEDNTDWMEA
ncbi:MAG: hypothetical protein Q9208_005637 [Pyrenodesmia sp. 3 TL-2023]